eukprot:TRINITY_DN29810_c0_g1_i1.p1 TRINITY_DN29810_c0_g1~~TRINITY_DN29810_c0_g1_i1.p1  ORF type:complete len:460 (+),score=54.45 TRINITY_DN29810_c0_g1_i1:33-1382(+)
MATSETDLEKHARRFRSCRTPQTVLRRYLTEAERMDTRTLQRHMCHVCAWIALASPLTDAANRIGTSDLSPVLVLTRMLGLRARARLSDRLWVALRSVSSCCSTVLTDASAEELPNKGDWLELRKSLPPLRKRTRLEGDGKEAADADFARDANLFKRVRRLNRATTSWKGVGLIEQQALADSFESRLREIVDCASPDTVELRQLLYDVTGALSSPRAKAMTLSHDSTMDLASQEALRISANAQKRVRGVLLEALKKWRMDLELEDDQIEPVLQLIRKVTAIFVEKHGDVRLACAGGQWMRLGEVVGIAGETQQKGRHSSYKKQASVKATINGGTYTPSDRVQRLRYVKRLDEVVVLRCTKCGYELRSQWYFCFGSRNSVLRPQNGHCGGTQFTPVPAMHSSRDTPGILDICDHGKKRSDCVECGGASICIHKKRARNCTICGPKRRRSA